MTVEISEADPDVGTGPHLEMIVESSERGFIERDIVSLMLLRAYAFGLSLDAVLADARADLVRRHAPMDRPFQDVMEIGGGRNHDGHEI